MKLTIKQLKQIIVEELSEVMVDPSNPTDRALKDPQVPEKIKALLKEKDPENRKYGVYLLTLMFPDKYDPSEIEGHQGSEEYQKTFKKQMAIHKDVAKLRGIKDDLENLSGNVRVSFSLNRVNIVSKDKEAILDAIKLAKDKHSLSPDRESKSPGDDQFINTRNMMGDTFYSATFKMKIKLEPQAYEAMRIMAGMKG